MLSAQTNQVATEEEVLKLDPFTVVDSGLEGYAARTSASGLGFVVDTAKLPITVTTLTPSILGELGVVKVEDALRYVSGVGNIGRNMRVENYTIRGFGTGATLRNGELFRVPSDMAIIDRVEVIKGPSSIIYGTADPSGVVNTVTKKASFKAAHSLAFQWDEYGSARGVLDWNQPIITEGNLKFAARLIAAQGREEYHRPNEFRDRTLLATNFRLEYGRNTLIDVDLHRTEEDGRVNRIQIPWDRGYPPFDPTVFAIGLVDVVRDFTFVTPNDDWDFRSKGVDARWTQHLSDSLTFQLAYVDAVIDSVQYFNLGTGRMAPNALGEYRSGNFQMIVEPGMLRNRTYAGKLLYDRTFGATRHRATFGFRDNSATNYEYAYYDKTLRTDTTLQVISDNTGGKVVRFQGAPRSVFSLSDPNSAVITGTTSATNPDPVDVRTVYLTDYISTMNDRLTLLGGVSFIDIRSQNESAVVPQAGFTYEIGRGVNGYFLYSQSAKPNGPASTIDPSLGFLPPEKGEGYEFGLKFSPAQGRLSGGLAFYQIVRQNIVQFLGGGNFGVNNNIPSGEQIAKGVELDVTFSPTPEWSILMAYAYTDAYVSKQEIAVTPDYDGDGVSDAVGLPLEGVAENDFRLWSSYRFKPAGPLKGLSFGGGFTWRQGPINQFSDYSQRYIQETDDSTRIDLFAAYQMKVFGLDSRFQANWQNVTDADFLDRRGYTVQPSTVSLTLEVKF